MACVRLLVAVPLILGALASALPHQRSRRIAFMEMGTALAEESAQSAPRTSRLANTNAGDWRASVFPRQVNAAMEGAAEPSSWEEVKSAEPSNRFAMQAAEPSEKDIKAAAPSSLEITKEESPTNIVEMEEAAAADVEETDATSLSLLGEMEKGTSSNNKYLNIAVPSNLAHVAELASSNLIEKEESAPSNLVEETESAPSNFVKMEAAPSRLVEVEIAPSRLVEMEVAAPSRLAETAYRRHISALRFNAAYPEGSPPARHTRLVDLGAMAAMAAAPYPRRSSASSIHVQTRQLSGVPQCYNERCENIQVGFRTITE